jgi:hypothetical protein
VSSLGYGDCLGSEFREEFQPACLAIGRFPAVLAMELVTEYDYHTREVAEKWRYAPRTAGAWRGQGDFFTPHGNWQIAKYLPSQSTFKALILGPYLTAEVLFPPVSARGDPIDNQIPTDAPPPLQSSRSWVWIPSLAADVVSNTVCHRTRRRCGKGFQAGSTEHSHFEFAPNGQDLRRPFSCFRWFIQFCVPEFRGGFRQVCAVIDII